MSNESNISLTKGFTFSFEDDGNSIDAWFSAFSGLEKVYVNGVLVCSQRNFSRNSKTTFKIGTNEYSIDINAKSLLKGPFICTLNRNGQAYKRQKLLFPKPKKRAKISSLLTSFLIFLVVGTLFGLAHSYWQLPSEFIYIFIALVLIIVTSLNSKNHKSIKPVIENEENL